MKRITISILTLAFFTTISISCREKKTTGEKVEEAVEEVGESVEEGVEEVKDEIDDATDGN